MNHLAIHSPSVVEPRPARPRLVSIDFVRLLVVASVIATHVMATGPLYGSVTSGAVWMLTHVSRNVFFLLTALVLGYTYGPGRPLKIWTFWRRRFPLVALPYAVWTAIYMIVNGVGLHSISEFLSRFVHNLLVAGGMYHLYFLVVTMQFYACFPLIRGGLSWLEHHWKVALAVSFILQLGATSVMYYGLNTGPALNWWLAHPDENLLSYQWYMVAGLVLGLRFEHFTHWLAQRHTKLWCGLGLSVVAAGGWILYAFRLTHNVAPDIAAATFQPYLVLTSAAAILACFAAGEAWVQAQMPVQKWVHAVAENSFGIYLSHVLVLGIVGGLLPERQSWPVAILALLTGVPLVYVISFGLTEVFRRTPLSALLTGRSRRKGRPQPLRHVSAT